MGYETPILVPNPVVALTGTGAVNLNFMGVTTAAGVSTSVGANVVATTIPLQEGAANTFTTSTHSGLVIAL